MGAESFQRRAWQPLWQWEVSSYFQGLVADTIRSHIKCNVFDRLLLWELNPFNDELVSLYGNGKYHPISSASSRMQSAYMDPPDCCKLSRRHRIKLHAYIRPTLIEHICSAIKRCALTSSELPLGFNEPSNCLG